MVKPFESEKLVMCSHCKKFQDVNINSAYIREEGSHTIYCENCSKSFTITTKVTLTFTSHNSFE
jgi:hypothetical protein